MIVKLTTLMFCLACVSCPIFNLDDLTAGPDIGSSHAMQHTLANQHKAITRSKLLIAAAFVVQGKGPKVSGLQQPLRQQPKWLWLLLLSCLTLFCW